MKYFIHLAILFSTVTLLSSNANALPLEEEPRLALLWKIHALYLAEARILLADDGDLGGTVRNSSKGRALYEASGALQAYTKIASDRVELYNAKDQWIGDIYVSTPQVIDETEKALPTWTVTGNVGRDLGTITKTETGYEYRDHSGKLIGSSTLEAKALSLLPLPPKAPTGTQNK